MARRALYSVDWSVGQLICLHDQRVYCDKMTDCIWMPFVMVSRVSKGMGVLDEGPHPRWGMEGISGFSPSLL